MHVLILAEVNSGGQVQQIATTFGVDWPHLISQIISFAIVCFLLHRFAYKPILQMLEQRRRQIADGIAEREVIKAELAQVEVQRHEIMLRANAEADKLIEEAHLAAARVREKEMQSAIAEAEQIIIKSHEAALREHDRMLRELKQELAFLVLQAASIATGRLLTPEDERRLAEEALMQIAKAA
jgi:F-type H+-transporting ATPase subunit b